MGRKRILKRCGSYRLHVGLTFPPRVLKDAASLNTAAGSFPQTASAAEARPRTGRRFKAPDELFVPRAARRKTGRKRGTLHPSAKAPRQVLPTHIFRSDRHVETFEPDTAACLSPPRRHLGRRGRPA